MSISSSPAYLDGAILRLEECRISALDRGFLFGDSIYEMIPVYRGKTFEAAAHLDRMARGLAEVGIENPHTEDEWQAIVDLLIEHSPQSDLTLYLQVSRGVEPRNHYSATLLKPTVFGMTMPLPASGAESGVYAITAEDLRWHRCDIKTTSLAANVLLRKQAIEAGAQETILFRDGYLTEGAASNVFVVVENRLMTSPADRQILPGITREIVIRLAKQNDISFEERAVSLEEFKRAEEVWLSSSTKDILPVISIDGAAVGDGKPGALWRQFSSWISEMRT